MNKQTLNRIEHIATQHFKDVGICRSIQQATGCHGYRICATFNSALIVWCEISYKEDKWWMYNLYNTEDIIQMIWNHLEEQDHIELGAYYLGAYGE